MTVPGWREASSNNRYDVESRLRDWQFPTPTPKPGHPAREAPSRPVVLLSRLQAPAQSPALTGGVLTPLGQRREGLHSGPGQTNTRSSYRSNPRASAPQGCIPSWGRAWGPHCATLEPLLLSGPLSLPSAGAGGREGISRGPSGSDLVSPESLFALFFRV